MAPPSELEKSLRSLIQRYQQVRRENQALAARVLEANHKIEELEAGNASLRQRIDLLDKQRFRLKQFKDERKLIRRKLASAVTRLESLEQEL